MKVAPMVGGSVERMSRERQRERRALIANPASDESREWEAIARIFKSFRGRPLSGKLESYIVPEDAPIIGAQLGTLDRLTLADGCDVTFENNPAVLCAGADGRLFIGLTYRYSNAKDVRRGESYSFGRVDRIEYTASKEHIYHHTRDIPFYHYFGDEGGRRPRLIFKDGCLSLLGGDYTITKHGIVN
jgi:hypothetical protein